MLRQNVFILNCLVLLFVAEVSLSSAMEMPIASAGILVGINNNVALVSINPETGDQKAIGPPISHFVQGQGLAAVDQNSDIYYLIGLNLTSGTTTMLGLSTQSGAVISQTNLPFAQTWPVGRGQYCVTDSSNSSVDQVFAVGRPNDPKNDPEVFRADPKTNQLVGPIATISQARDEQVGCSCFDEQDRILFVDYQFNSSIVGLPGGTKPTFVGINVDTGKMEYVPRQYFMETMDYDPVTGLIFGFGLEAPSENKLVRVLIAFDGFTNDFYRLDELNIPINALHGVTALDWQNRILYGFFSDFDGHSPAKLIGVNVDEARVVSQVDACDSTFAGCLWSMRFVAAAAAS